MNAANPAAPPGAGAKGVLVGLTGSFKLLLLSALATLAVPPAGGVGYDLGVRYAAGAFVFHAPPPCNLASLNPHGRFLLEAQMTAFNAAFLAAVSEQGRARGCRNGRGSATFLHHQRAGSGPHLHGPARARHLRHDL